VEDVALGEIGGEWRVFEVPHEWSGVEEVDGGYAEWGEWRCGHQRTSLGLVD